MIEKSFHKTIERSLAVKILLFSLFALSLLVIHWQRQASPNLDDAKLRELQQLSADVPVFPTFKEVSTDYGSKPTDAGIYKYYQSTADYDEVKSFYSKMLTQKGWGLSGEENLYDWSRDYGGRKLTFKKGEYIVAIQYEGESSTGRTWDYGVSFVWRSN